MTIHNRVSYYRSVSTRGENNSWIYKFRVNVESKEEIEE